MRINQESNFLEVLKYHCFQERSLIEFFFDFIYKITFKNAVSYLFYDILNKNSLG